ncbi:MAG: hypothetical protein GWP91_21695 [Rhodobacterales bacterium]|nr:hypothetical protein [Rhodobacterales bacterium]
MRCISCGSGLAVSYPTGVIDQLRKRGKRFADDKPVKVLPVPRPEAPRASLPAPPASPTVPLSQSMVPQVSSLDAGLATHANTQVDRTTVDATELGQADVVHDSDRTVAGLRSPYGALPNNIPEPEGGLAVNPFPTAATEAYNDMEHSLDESDGGILDLTVNLAEYAKDPVAKKSKQGKVKSSFQYLVGTGLTAIVVAGVLGLGIVGGVFRYYGQDLPTIEALRAYEPPTVTVVTDANGEILGEIFEQRRYVLPVEEIPDHVKNAFLAAEDASFYEHGGVDFLGILRAIGRNAAKGRMAQGASTITQQVARNFLLTRDKKIERKIKEAILSWRIEDAYTKDHILYLYLNEIFLGSQAYGVEAASRAYYGKSVRDISVAEAAILAGLPQRPSDYSPHRHFEKARARQEYVIGQMVAKNYLTEAEGKAALAEEIVINPRRNAFLEQAPHFTEHVRRYLVDKYGEELVLNQGLQVKTTCDLDLQRLAQASVISGVHDVDQRMGFRRDAITHVAADKIQAKRDEVEAKLKKDWAYNQDPAGRIAEPDKSIVETGKVYSAVILEVNKKWARIAIGSHEGIVPMAWSKWVYDPNPKRSWRYRDATDLTEKIDTDGDKRADAPILQKGDVVLVKIESMSTEDTEVAKAFKGTPGASDDQLAVRLWQDPEVESALLSMDAQTGAIRAMVGGADFTKSQFNRATQSRRQVGSTFKPIVYAAAIESKRVTTASMVADAPLAFATSEEFVWKPANYGNDYLGNITLRKALAMSRNTCTIRVLESIDPGMSDDVVYNFARRLGIGGTPLLALEESHVNTPENDLLCPWTKETEDSTICMDRYPAKDPNISNTRHRKEMSPDDNYQCRACDMSMGLGSASLTMEELVRAYGAFASGGMLVEPYYIEEVRDRHGNVLETHDPIAATKIMEPEVATIATWLLQGVVQGGTGFQAGHQLGLNALAGKTGTTNDEKDAWFIGFTQDVITAVWVGFDQPRSLGMSSTGGRTALPIWIDYMRVAAPKGKDRPFPIRGEVEWAHIDEATGRRVSGGGRAYPFIRETAPESTGYQAGQVSMEDLTTEL